MSKTPNPTTRQYVEHTGSKWLRRDDLSEDKRFLEVPYGSLDASVVSIFKHTNAPSNDILHDFLNKKLTLKSKNYKNVTAEARRENQGE